MKKIQPPPHCKVCGSKTGRYGVFCAAVMLNGCKAHICYLCWPDHSAIHDKEWQEMTDEQRDALYQERIPD